MKSLLLIQPTTSQTLDIINYSRHALNFLNTIFPDSVFRKHLEGKKAINLPPLSMMILAAITPRDEFEIEFVDERVDPIDFNHGADLVAINATTLTVNRAYGIADKFRERGSQVVMGGVHPTVLSDEALMHADAVVLGEAEYVWGDILTDFVNGRLEATYFADTLLDLGKDYVLPDTSILKGENYLVDVMVETSRGCPYNCNFCSAPFIFGESYRTRLPEDVINQISQSESRYLYFTDDNLIGNRDNIKKILKGIISLDKRWLGSVDTTLIRDKELSDLVVESGCKFLIVGFESLSSNSLKLGRKKHNKSEEYKEFIDYFQERGVVVGASFLFGFDGEDLGDIERFDQFVQDTNLILPYAGILTPYPGTDLHNSLQDQGRILHTEWQKYSVREGVPVFQLHPNGIDHEEYAAVIKRMVAKYNTFYFMKKLKNSPGFLEKVTS